MNKNEVLPTACRLANSLIEATQIVYNHCTAVNYTTVHSTLSYLKWCELLVRVQPHFLEGYYINLLSCPAGFIQSNGVCNCDPILNTILSITIIYVTLTNKLYYDLLVVGYLLSLSMTLTNITSLLTVHYTIVYLNHHNLGSLFQTHGVNLKGVVYCADIVKNISVLCLGLLTVIIALQYICYLLYQ